ncbi:NADP-dependent oxidoreductase [Williamsia serinedens]|uniref:NADPH:quinone reductase n=1 Tax=Williamsia serinedens TaxID=391736 RepID=A0ABT1H536_9NOCA|nr:NADP-dependent oxidoreductase [Williamsia serinedens]MCP2162069.1 NADPH:quinone reductase [Williamsia serinedens]
MSATVVATAFGGPEVLAVRDLDVTDPGQGEVVVDFHAVGVNPVEYKTYSGAMGSDESTLPMRLGNEGAGVIVAVGPDTTGPAGPLAVGDEVVVFRGVGTYSARSVQPASAVVPKPSALSWEVAAGMLLTATTAHDGLEVVGITADDTLLVHGASGAVGLAVVQLARLAGARVIGTAREENHGFLREIGAEPVAYGDGLLDRVRELAPDGVTVAYDAVGTDEAVDVSLALVEDRTRIVTIAAFGRAESDGFRSIGGGDPESSRRRDAARTDLLALAADGRLRTPIARTFALSDVTTAHTELQRSHPIGKFVLLP